MFDNILIKTPEQIEGIRAACRDAALVLDYIEPFVKAGVTTEYLDDLMLRYTEDVLKDKDQKILVYCRSGNRSQMAAAELISMGYTQVYDFGGIIDWPY